MMTPSPRMPKKKRPPLPPSSAPAPPPPPPPSSPPFVSQKGLQYRRWETDARTEIGTDEAGRGPLFGRTYAAAVVLPPLETLTADARAVLARARDSKTVPKGQMAALAADIRRVARASAVCFAEPEEIDRMNIRQAVLRAMRSAIANVRAALPSAEPCYVLADGTDLATYDAVVEVVAEPKADARFVSVACASILAKAAHDAHILELCAAHPELDARYDLRKNMGYGTAAHLAGLAQFGPSQWHRRSFRPIRKDGAREEEEEEDTADTTIAAVVVVPEPEKEVEAPSAAKRKRQKRAAAPEEEVVVMEEECTLAAAPKSAVAAAEKKKKKKQKVETTTTDVPASAVDEEIVAPVVIAAAKTKKQKKKPIGAGGGEVAAVIVPAPRAEEEDAVVASTVPCSPDTAAAKASFPCSPIDHAPNHQGKRATKKKTQTGGGEAAADATLGSSSTDGAEEDKAAAEAATAVSHVATSPPPSCEAVVQSTATTYAAPVPEAKQHATTTTTAPPYPAPPQAACDVRVNPDTDVLVLRTPQVGTLHKVFNAMKELMADLTVIVDRAEGAVTIDGYHRLLGYYVSTVLRFEQQICRCPKLTFTVPASSFYTMLTKASPKHTMYLFVPQSSFVNGNVDYIHFQFETPAAAGGMDAAPTRVFTISLPTLNEPDQDNLQLPPIAYPMRVTLLSAQFSKDMRDLAEIGGENLQIEIRGGDCYFSSVLQTGATLGGRIHYPDICAAAGPEDGGEDGADGAEPFVFRERYPLKTIKRIIKCSTLSTDVVIGVCAGMPLSIYYPIGADLGDMNVYITYAR